MIYFDTCALVQLVRADRHSTALGRFIDARPDMRWFVSELAKAELARALRRVNHDDRGKVIDAARLRAELDYADQLWDNVDLIPVTTKVLVDAGALEQPFLRTLDAIHLASAATLRAGLSALVTYDKRLAAAAAEAGLPVAMPS
ncbi:MAG TPA: type II toxin-antitoxin system VapC family toxin [Trebonia sp.]|nr:type II toxin-antitoxin system VapC family toxin [Trebonia sp.]